MSENRPSRRVIQILANIVVDNAFDKNNMRRANYESICDSCVHQKFASYETVRCALGINAARAIENYACNGHEPNRMFPNLPPSQE